MRSRVRAFDRWLTLEHPDTEEAEKVIEEVLVGNVYRVEPDHIAGKVVVDAGANVGTFSVLAIALGCRSLTCIEPDEKNIAYLEENVVRAAKDVGLDMGQVIFDSGAIEDPALVRVRYKGAGATGYVVGGESGSIPVRSFADVLKTASGRFEGGGINFLKVDVEGGEYGFFRTASDDEMQRVNLIRMEWHGHATAQQIDGEGPIGELVTKLLRTHSVTAFGRPADGGILLAHAYEWPDDA